MIILPQIKELQKGNLSDLNGTGGSLPAGCYKNITGTFSSVGSDCTSVIALNFNASITNTGSAVTSPYTYSYPSSWPTITSNAYTSIPTVTLNSGSPGTAGSKGGGGGGTAGGGASAGGNGGNGGAGGNGVAGRRWDEQTLACNNSVYGACGIGGSGGTGAAGSPSINGVNGTNGANSVSINLINKLYSWGYNGDASLGDGTLTNRCLPTAICSSLNFICVLAEPNLRRVYALTDNCKLYTWGRNDVGVLANGGVSNACSPTAICPSCNFNKVYHIYATSYVIGTDNKLYSVGQNNVGQLGAGDLINRCVLFNVCSACSFKNITTNDDNPTGAVLATGIDDKLYAWGDNTYGQLGNGNTTNQCSPVAICSSCTFSCIYNRNYTTIALTTTNKLFTWGLNDRGQLGNGNTTNQSSPVAVCSACSFNSFDVSCYLCVCAVSNGFGGFFYTNYYYNYIHAIGTDCKLYSWGDNSIGQLGNGNITNQCLPVAICSACNFICVYTKNATSFALGSDCKLYAWGCNNYGQLGNGNTTNQCSPVAICPSCSFNCVFQGTGATSTYALDVNGRLFTWGYNFYGELGNGNLTNQCLPVNICPSCNFKCIFGNYRVIYAVDVNDKLYGWGTNDYGEIGNNCTVSCQCNPFQIRSDLFFNKFTVSINHIHAITTCGGNGGRGGNTYTLTAPAGGTGGAGGGGGGGGQSIFCRYSYPSYVAQNLDALPTPNNRFHGDGGPGGIGNTTGATAGSAGGIPDASWPTTNSRSGSGGTASSPSSTATDGGSGGCITIDGPTSAPSSGTTGDLGSPPDTFSFGGGGTAGTAGNSGSPELAYTNAGCPGLNGTAGQNGTFPSAGGGGGGRGGNGGNGRIQYLGANGGAGGAGSAGGTGGAAGRSLGLMVYNSVCGCILTFGSCGSNALSGSPGSLGESCLYSTTNSTISYVGACGGNGGMGGNGGQGSAGRVLLVGRCTQFLCNNSFCANGIPNGDSGVNGSGEKLYTWGNNNFGQLGDGSSLVKCVLTNICNSLDFNHMISDTCSVFALTCNKKLYAWGVNDSGQLGNGNTTNQCSPIAICSSLNFRCIMANCKI